MEQEINLQSLTNCFKSVRNYLAGKAIGITRDVALLDEVVKCLFSYVYGNLYKSSKTGQELATLYRNEFANVKSELPDVFANDTELLLDPDSIEYIHTSLSYFDFESSDIDPLSILYQTFIGSEIRGNEGQFFTPHNTVQLLVEATKPDINDRIIDPACGAGSFLSYTARYLKQKSKKEQSISNNLYGVEKDAYLANLSKSHVALSVKGEANILCGDSIERIISNNGPISFLKDESFDVVLANPPFGAKIKIGTEETKKKFDLAYKWKASKETNKFEKSEKINPNPTPQTLFLELCIRLLKPGGRLGVVVPESLITSNSTKHVVQYLLSKINLRAVIGMPEELFKTSGKGGTHTKTCLLIGERKSDRKSNNDKIFMAEAKWCGHDSRGNVIPKNDIPIILSNFKEGIEDKNHPHLGYYLNSNSIQANILAPRYYNPEPRQLLKQLEKSHNLITLGELIDKNILSISTGDEVGKLAYGTGDIPFIRTSDISNWEIKLDPKHCVSEEIYNKFHKKQDVQEGDILVVKDGSYLIGTCAFISKFDTKILFQSHLYKIRVNDKNTINPYLLLAALSSDPVKKQIQSKKFTLDIIDSLGNRIKELVIPVPKDENKRNQIISMVKRSIYDRIESRELARKAQLEICIN